MLQWISRSKDASGAQNPPGKTGGPSLDWLNGSSERYYGLENFGNTCYCNSVLQALYFSLPFRACVLAYSYPLSSAVLAAASSNLPLPPLDEQPVPISSVNSSTSLPLSAQISQLANEKNSETLLTTLQDLFSSIKSMKKQTGVVKPNAFVSRLRTENVLFQGTTQQDAQEFLNYVLNAIAEILLRHKREYVEKLKLLLPAVPGNGESDAGSEGSEKKAYKPDTWVHELFEGLLTNETKCLTCETITNRDEAFLDLSVDITQHSSLSTCLRNFSTSETLCAKDKFYCDVCKSLQEAEKRMKIKSLPNILAVHLKRFKYQENLQRFIKLNYRVVFPFELKLFNTSDDAEDPDRLYNLSSIIIHLGIGPHQGHYISIVKSNDHWILFDDENVDRIEEHELSRFFGDLNQPGTGYMFFYERVGFDVSDILERMNPGKGNMGTSNSSQSHTTGDTTLNLSTTSGSVPIAIPTTTSFGRDEAAPSKLVASTVSPPPVTSTAGGGSFGFGSKFKRPSFHNTHPNHSASESSSVPGTAESRGSGEYHGSEVGAPAQTSATTEGTSTATSWWKRKT